MIPKILSLLYPKQENEESYLKKIKGGFLFGVLTFHGVLATVDVSENPLLCSERLEGMAQHSRGETRGLLQHLHTHIL